MHILNTISERVPVRLSGEGQWDGGAGDLVGRGRDVKRVTKPCARVTPCCAATVSKLNAKQNLVGSLVAFLVRQGRQLLLLEMRQWHLTLLWEKTTLRKAKTQDAEALLSYKREEEGRLSDCQSVFIGGTLQRSGKL